MENMTFYRYHVNWWFDENRGDIDDRGFVLAKSYGHAVEQVSRIFDDINSITVEAINESNYLSYEDILEALGADVKSSQLGPQIIEALQDAIDMTKKVEVDVALENND